MSKFATNSWQAREALIERKAYRTYGSMYAVEGPTLPEGHRLPIEWRRRYLLDESEIVYTVVSYRTPIAWVKRDGTVVKVDHKWSITTTGHQGMLYALDASREARAGIYEAAQRERQAERDRRAARREQRVAMHSPHSYPAPSYRSSGTDTDGFHADAYGAMRAMPEDHDALIDEVQGMLVR